MFLLKHPAIMLLYNNIILLLVFVGIGISQIIPKVKTLNGVVVGHHRKSYNGRIYSAFEGIPYARKPVGQLRFEVS